MRAALSSVPETKLVLGFFGVLKRSLEEVESDSTRGSPRPEKWLASLMGIKHWCVQRQL